MLLLAFHNSIIFFFLSFNLVGKPTFIISSGQILRMGP